MKYLKTQLVFSEKKMFSDQLAYLYCVFILH